MRRTCSSSSSSGRPWWWIATRGVIAMLAALDGGAGFAAHGPRLPRSSCPSRRHHVRSWKSEPRDSGASSRSSSRSSSGGGGAGGGLRGRVSVMRAETGGSDLGLGFDFGTRCVFVWCVCVSCGVEKSPRATIKLYIYSYTYHTNIETRNSSVCVQVCYYYTGSCIENSGI